MSKIYSVKRPGYVPRWEVLEVALPEFRLVSGTVDPLSLEIRTDRAMASFRIDDWARGDVRLSLQPRKISSRSAFVVSDDGAPLAGAIVSFATSGRQILVRATDAQGVCTIPLCDDERCYASLAGGKLVNLGRKQQAVPPGGRAEFVAQKACSLDVRNLGRAGLLTVSVIDGRGRKRSMEAYFFAGGVKSLRPLRAGPVRVVVRVKDDPAAPLFDEDIVLRADRENTVTLPGR